MAQAQQQQRSQAQVTSNIPIMTANNRNDTLNINFSQQNTDSEERTFDTLINTIFSPTPNDCQQNYATTICYAQELPCFYAFLDTCSPKQDDDLVYGISCLRHTNIAHRTFTTMKTHNSVNMQPISLKPATCERNMFLWSTLTNVSYARAKDLISFMGLNTLESNNLARFIMSVSEPHGSRQNSEEYQRLYQYLSAYCQYAIKCLDAITDRHKIVIPLDLTDNFITQNKSNNFLAEIINKANNNTINHQTLNDNSKKYYVPLTMFNIIDQLHLLSYRIFCGVGRIGLAPNVSIANGNIFVGSGLTIKNYVNKVDISKLRAYYPEPIYRTIRHIHGDNVHSNFDVLVLLAVPSGPNVFINPQIFIAKRKYLTSTFDVEKLENLIYC